MNDLISRQDAIEALIQEFYSNVDDYISEKQAVHAIDSLPSAQPERKKGRWIRNDNGTYTCSVCQSWILEEQHYYARYCLHCGADMRGENYDKG